jgi:hypothetical protein
LSDFGRVFLSEIFQNSQAQISKFNAHLSPGKGRPLLQLLRRSTLREEKDKWMQRRTEALMLLEQSQVEPIGRHHNDESTWRRMPKKGRNITDWNPFLLHFYWIPKSLQKLDFKFPHTNTIFSATFLKTV